MLKVVKSFIWIYTLNLGKECEAVSEAASAVYPDHLHAP